MIKVSVCSFVWWHIVTQTIILSLFIPFTHANPLQPPFLCGHANGTKYQDYKWIDGLSNINASLFIGGGGMTKLESGISQHGLTFGSMFMLMVFVFTYIHWNDPRFLSVGTLGHRLCKRVEVYHRRFLKDYIHMSMGIPKIKTWTAYPRLQRSM